MISSLLHNVTVDICQIALLSIRKEISHMLKKRKSTLYRHNKQKMCGINWLDCYILRHILHSEFPNDDDEHISTLKTYTWVKTLIMTIYISYHVVTGEYLPFRHVTFAVQITPNNDDGDENKPHRPLLYYSKIHLSQIGEIVANDDKSPLRDSNDDKYTCTASNCIFDMN